jgi:predicted transcriptional regulator
MSELTTRKESESLPIQKEMEAVLSSLANEDALKIFQEAKEGITSSTQAIKKLKLTQKRYYARLKPLIETGLIEKTDSRYELTFMGKIVYEVLYRKLVKALENKDRIALIDKLNKAKSLSKEEKEQIASTISVKDKIIGYSDIFGGIKPVEIIRDYEELTKRLISIIENAKEFIYLASKYFEPSVAEIVMRSYGRGVKVRVIDGDMKNLSKKIQMMRMLMSNPGTLKLYLAVANAQDFEIRHREVPYSFFTIDGKYSGLELIDPVTSNFALALIFSNEEVSEKLVEIFDSFFSSAKANGKSSVIEALNHHQKRKK